MCFLEKALDFPSDRGPAALKNHLALQPRPTPPGEPGPLVVSTPGVLIAVVQKGLCCVWRIAQPPAVTSCICSIFFVPDGLLSVVTLLGLLCTLQLETMLAY